MTESIYWYVKLPDFDPRGPYSSEVEAWGATKTPVGVPIDGAVVWPEREPLDLDRIAELQRVEDSYAEKRELLNALRS